MSCHLCNHSINQVIRCDFNSWYVIACKSIHSIVINHLLSFHAYLSPLGPVPPPAFDPVSVVYHCQILSLICWCSHSFVHLIFRWLHVFPFDVHPFFNCFLSCTINSFTPVMNSLLHCYVSVSHSFLRSLMSFIHEFIHTLIHFVHWCHSFLH